MTNDRSARNYLKQAGYRLRQVRQACKDQMWEVAVRQSQECAELALKGALRLVGVEPPKWHDVGGILRAEASRFPPWFSEEIEALAVISLRLRELREISFYGDEAGEKTPEELFGKEEATLAFQEAETVFSLCERVLEENSRKMEGNT